MSKLPIIAVAAFFLAFAAQAAEPTTGTIKPAPAAPAAAAPKTTAAPQKAALSQQDKMRECNKQATGKKGAERKAFMKTCLSRKA